METRINLPVPEPKDLPRFWKFRGWYPTDNGLGWYCFLQYENPTFPAMGQQIYFSHAELNKLSEARRVKALMAEFVRVIEETNMSLKALGWYNEYGYNQDDIKRVRPDLT